MQLQVCVRACVCVWCACVRACVRVCVCADHESTTKLMLYTAFLAFPDLLAQLHAGQLLDLGPEHGDADVPGKSAQREGGGEHVHGTHSKL